MITLKLMWSASRTQAMPSFKYSAPRWPVQCITTSGQVTWKKIVVRIILMDMKKFIKNENGTLHFE